MAVASNRASIIAKSHKVLKKHFRPIPTVGGRSVMESLLFACCLENSRYDKAEEAFARIQTMYFDWNEIRVATARELAESFEGLADPLAAARNLKRTLQSIFETLYRFDLEDFKKQNLGQAVLQLQGFPGTTKFTVAYVVQHALGGHSIPLCEASLEIMRIVGAISESEFEQGAVPGLERAIPKDQGHDFSSLLHQLGYEFMHAPSNSKWRSILLEIAPDAKERFVRRPKPTVVQPKAPDVVPVPAVPSSAKKKETTKPPLPAAKDEAKPSGKPILTPTKNSTTEKLETKSIPAKKTESKTEPKTEPKTAGTAESAAKVAKAAKPIAKPIPKSKSKPKHPTAKKGINKNKSKAPSAPKKPTPAKGKKPGKNVAGAKSKSKSSSKTLARKKPR